MTDATPTAEKVKAQARGRHRQVAALPFRYTDGALEVLIITSRETGRFIIPKGWPMKRRADPEAAAVEAREEAGLIGKVRRNPIGTYSYFKRLIDRFQFVKVDVYPREVKRQLETWREKQSRQMAWLSTDKAAILVDEPQLITIIQNLEHASIGWRNDGGSYSPLANGHASAGGTPSRARWNGKGLGKTNCQTPEQQTNGLLAQARQTPEASICGLHAVRPSGRAIIAGFVCPSMAAAWALNVAETAAFNLAASSSPATRHARSSSSTTRPRIKPAWLPSGAIAVGAASHIGKARAAPERAFCL